MKEPLPGRYRHYKGHVYEVLGIALHTEIGEELVVYRLNPSRRLWGETQDHVLGECYVRRC